LITPPKGGAGGGSCLPSIGAVAAGEPGGAWASAVGTNSRARATNARARAGMNGDRRGMVLKPSLLAAKGVSGGWLPAK
jgi:hypothetical protein